MYSVITDLMSVLLPALFTSFVETVTGTAPAQPVITLTAGEEIGLTDIIIENVTTGETFEWSGTIANADVLVVNCDTGVVTLNGINVRASMGPEYISLNPGANTINVYGFIGSLGMAYTPRYL